MKSISILIPVYNNLKFTKKCIKELNELISTSTSGRCAYHIVVIDDGSSDGTSDWIKVNHPDISLLKGDGNLWWSGGINMGAEYSLNILNADFLLLWNNDIIPAPDYFTQLDNLIIAIDDETLAGSKIFYYDQLKKNIIWSFGGIFNPKTGKRYMLGYDQEDSDEFAHPATVDWLTGMGTLVPANIVRKIGLWDDVIFPQYHGDSDFTYRAKSGGYKVIAFPQLVLWNDTSVSGIKHGGTIKGFIRTLTDRRSNSNFLDNYKFYKRHSVSILAYYPLFLFYFRFFGSFCKWNILGLFGIKKAGRF